MPRYWAIIGVGPDAAASFIDRWPRRPAYGLEDAPSRAGARML